jgi:hypothetical protein
MNGLDVLERELAAALRRRAGDAPEGEGWDGIQRRIRRRRARARRRLSAAGLAVAALLGGTLLATGLLGRSGTERVAVGPGPGATAGLPRLVPALPGFEPVHAEEGHARPGPWSSITRSVFTQPGLGWSGKVLVVEWVPAGVPFGIGELSPSARAVDVGGRQGWLDHKTAIASTLGWREEAGEAVYLIGVKLSDDELLAAATVLALGNTVNSHPEALPPGLGLTAAPGPESGGVSATSEVQLQRGPAQVSLRLAAAGEGNLAGLAADRLASAAEAAQVPVRGTTGLLVRYEHGAEHSLMWLDPAGFVGEVRAGGVAAGEVVAIADSLAEIDEAQWRALVERFAPPEPPALDVEGARAAMCEARALWLAAHQAGNRAQAASVAARTRTLMGVAAEAGLGERSDIVVVIGRLGDAMASGDETTVRATPAGGCP